MAGSIHLFDKPAEPLGLALGGSNDGLHLLVAALLRTVLEQAKAGDTRAAEVVLARVWPVRRGRPVTLTLQPIKTAADVVAALGAVADAMAAGALTPEEASAVAGVLEAKRKAIETAELEDRVHRLEQTLGAGR